MLLWLFVVSLIQLLPLCTAVPFLEFQSGGGDDGDGDNYSRANRAEIAGIEIIEMSGVMARYFFVVNEYIDNRLTRQSCCMTDYENPLRWKQKSISCVDTSKYAKINGDVYTATAFRDLKEVMDQLYNDPKEDMSTEISETMSLTFTDVSSKRDFSFVMSSDDFISDEITITDDDFAVLPIAGFDAYICLWGPRDADRKEIVPYIWPQAV